MPSSVTTIGFLLLTVAVPLYFLARCGYRGWLRGFAVRAPAKLAFSTLGGALAAIVAADTVSRYPDVCRRVQHGTSLFITIFLTVFVILMYFSRAWNAEWRWSRHVPRDHWPVPLRLADSLAGAALDVLATLFLLGFIFASFNATSPILEAAAAPVHVISERLPSWTNGVTAWTGAWNDILTALGQPGDRGAIPSQAYCANGTGSPDTQGIAVLSFLVMATLGPLAVVLSFEPLAYGARDITIGSGCRTCAGTGRSRNLLLIGAACETCGGYGYEPARYGVGSNPLDLSIVAILLRSMLLALLLCCGFFAAWTR